MTNTDLARKLTAAGFTHDGFNSNNAWGFGGAIGDRYTSPNGNVVVKIATAYCRHLPPQGFITVTVAGRRVYDEPRGPSSDHTRAFNLATA
jgi:hypothetical protein